MATNDMTGEAAGGSSPKRPPTAAEQRASRHDASTDPQVLADDIEKTREELAQTLDAIADKVSPKRVAKRTSKKAGETARGAAEAAREGVQEAAEAVRETAQTATEAVKEKVATVKERVAPASDSSPARSPLGPATSVEVGSAAPVASPLPTGTLSVDAGDVPPAPVDTTGSLADAADSSTSGLDPAGADLPPYRPVLPASTAPSSRLPMLAGAGAALAVLLLLLRRRRR